MVLNHLNCYFKGRAMHADLQKGNSGLWGNKIVASPTNHFFPKKRQVNDILRFADLEWCSCLAMKNVITLGKSFGISRGNSDLEDQLAEHLSVVNYNDYSGDSPP